MDVKTLHMMAKAAADGASTALNALSSTEPFYQQYGGYPAYVAEYNRLLPHVSKEFGKEAADLFQPIDFKDGINPASVPGIMWRTYSELVAARLNALASYLQSKLHDTDKRVQGILDLLVANLRPSIYQDPKDEKELQNTIETIFRARSLSFLREKVRIKYSSKTFIPDFTFDSMDLTVEAKYCDKQNKHKNLIDEINADILAYQTKYTSCIFIVYDLGFIRDVSEFKSDIEGNENVFVAVVKK